MTINERFDRAVKGQRLTNGQAGGMFGVTDITISKWRHGAKIGDGALPLITDFIEAYESVHGLPEGDPEPIEEQAEEQAPNQFTVLLTNKERYRICADEFKIHPDEGLVCFLLASKRVAMFRLEDIKGVF